MKSLYKAFTMVALCLALQAHAQNSENRTLMGIGMQGANMSFGDTRSNYYKNWDLLPAITQIKFFAYGAKGLSIGWQLSTSYAKRSDSADSKFFLQWGVDIKYSFANGYILKQKSWFDPYLLVGGGLDKWGDTKGSINVGGGLNIWFNKNIGAFGQVQFNYLPHKKVSPETADPRPSFMHHSFGLVLRYGHGKDSDGDGIPDADDKCPNVPGPAETNGCPDTDHDGIIDKDDKCPTVAGLPEFQGCPDSDGDGIPDGEDDCPYEKGTVELKGCPDRDGDGIPDKADLCPDEKGPASTFGCPDRDGDGIADRDDACPDAKGPIQYGGCPDTDNDGIPDNEDKCPTVPGNAINHGCPEPPLDTAKKAEIQKKLSYAAKNIFFETGMATVKPESMKDLDSAVAILKKYDSLKVSIDGHSDNEGDDKSNIELSGQRADAVKNYLIVHGINATRLTSQGFGPSRPIADNNTPEGRAKNRRVEIKIRD